MPPTSAGRSHRTFRRLAARVRRNHNLCWLCGQTIDKTLPPTHPDSFTVDHKLPVSLNPDLAHTYTNLAAAHKRCNSSKGNGDGKHLTNQRASRDW